MNQKPLVSIGLPIFNEARWIRRALDSWLAQEFTDFEIVVADNASTDGTTEICREYAARDARVRLIENPLNVGMVRNHNIVFEFSQGQYFTWAGGHDHVHPAFIRKTLNVLQTNPSVAYCTVRSEFRDEDDTAWRVNKGGLDTRGMPPHQRFIAIIQHMTSGGTANIIYGLYRRSLLSQVLETKKTIGSDMIQLSELALLGDVVQLDDILYYRFLPQNRDAKARVKNQVKLIVGERSFEPDALMPYLGMLFGCISAIEESGLPLPERQTLYDFLGQEARRVEAILKREVSDFIVSGTEELEAVKMHSNVQRSRAIKILEGLNKARMFGYHDKKTIHLRKMCDRVLDGKFTLSGLF